MSALESILVRATAPGGGAAFTAAPGNSLTIRDAPKPARLLGISAAFNTAIGFLRITSPMLHDNVVGIQSRVFTLQNEWLPFQELYPQDTLTVFGSGSAVAGEIEQALLHVYYPDLPGVQARLIDAAELNKRAIEYHAFEVAITPDASGNYSGAVSITSLQDQLKANTDYAIMGANVSPAGFLNAVRITGPDLGNLGVCVPRLVGFGVGGYGPTESTDWFRRMSMVTGEKAIPVINSANKALTQIAAVANQGGGAAVTVSVHVMRLKR